MMQAALRSILLAASLSAAISPARPQTFDARARALDGDTVAVDFRLLGVDAFERRQLCQKADGCWECGKTAQDFAANVLRSRNATIRLTPSASYGRPVATVVVDGQDLGERLIQAGLAVPETQYLRNDPARATRYRSAFTEAKAQRAGAFAGKWIEPSQWRHGARLDCER
jgi:endonuclease YncB( thermonuclease family)